MTTQVSLRALHSIKPNPSNARTHSKRQIRQLADLIQRFGWTYPILIDERGIIIAGHGRYQAAKLLGLRDVPITVMSGLSDAERRAFAIADNKVAANAGWDRKTLAAELGELARLLPEFNLDIEITGFEAAEIDFLFEDFSDREADPADRLPPESKVTTSQLGDLWLLGNHRLKCGDALSEADVAALMGDARAAMLISDPPYNVRIDSVVGRGKRKHREFVAASGEMSRVQFMDFLTKAFSLAAQYSRDSAIHHIFIDWRHALELLTVGEMIYSELLNLCVWNKSSPGQGSFYRSQHELVFVFKNGTAPHRNNIELGKNGRNRSNVWTYPRVNTFKTGGLDDLSAHPTIKPVAMIADAMRDCSRRNDIVLDPFIGSGTTILAAEKVGRRGYGLELDRLYVDVAVRRWETFTGRDAILQETGETFSEVTAKRAETLADEVRR